MIKKIQALKLMNSFKIYLYIFVLFRYHVNLLKYKRGEPGLQFNKTKIFLLERISLPAGVDKINSEHRQYRHVARNNREQIPRYLLRIYLNFESTFLEHFRSKIYLFV